MFTYGSCTPSVGQGRIAPKLVDAAILADSQKGYSRSLGLMTYCGVAGSEGVRSFSIISRARSPGRCFPPQLLIGLSFGFHSREAPYSRPRPPAGSAFSVTSNFGRPMLAGNSTRFSCPRRTMVQRDIPSLPTNRTTCEASIYGSSHGSRKTLLPPMKVSILRARWTHSTGVTHAIGASRGLHLGQSEGDADQSRPSVNPLASL